MKRWEILIWVTLGASIVWGTLFWLNRSQSDVDQTPPLISQTVNTNARLAGSGSPLPAAADEDVVVEQQQFDGRIFTLSYDFETGNWQLDFLQQGSQTLRYLATENTFLYYNQLDVIWDEVDAELLHSEFRALIDIDDILFSTRQLNEFSRLAAEEKSAACRQSEAALCAVWRVSNPDNNLEIVIYVNKQTRKIDHIVSLNPANPAGDSILATYFYQPVEIDWPPEGEVRYLPSD